MEIWILPRPRPREERNSTGARRVHGERGTHSMLDDDVEIASSPCCSRTSDTSTKGRILDWTNPAPSFAQQGDSQRACLLPNKLWYRWECWFPGDAALRVCVWGGGAGLSGNGIQTVGNVRGSAFHRLPRRSGTAGLGRRRPPSYQPGLHVRYAAPLSTAQRSSRAQSWLCRSRNPVEVDSAQVNRVGGGLGPRQKSRPPGLKGRAGDRERRALSAVAPPTPRPWPGPCGFSAQVSFEKVTA